MQQISSQFIMKPESIRYEHSTIRIKKNFLLNVSCVLWLGNGTFRMIIAKILSVVNMQQLAEYILSFLIIVPLLLHFVLTSKPVGKYFVLFLGSCAIFFGITYMMHPEYKHWFTRDSFGVWDSIFRPDRGAIWGIFFIEASKTPERIWKNFKITSVFVFLYNLYLWFKAKSQGYWSYINASGIEEHRSYSLDFGYSMAFVLLVVLYAYMFERKKWQLIFSVVLLALIFDTGSRGSLLVVFVFAAFFFIDSKWKMRQRVRNLLIISVAGISVMLLWKHLLLLLISVMEKNHISSRTLNMLVSGEAMDDNGRDLIHDIILKKIAEKPYTGYGAFGDRQFIGPLFNWGYSHSILYEMWADFGVIFGTLFLALLVFLAMKIILTEKDPKTNAVCVILVSLASRLVLSNTFWGDPYYWMLIGFILMYYVNKHKYSESKSRINKIHLDYLRKNKKRKRFTIE